MDITGKQNNLEYGGLVLNKATEWTFNKNTKSFKKVKDCYSNKCVMLKSNDKTIINLY